MEQSDANERLDENNGLIYAFYFDGNGGGTEANWSDIEKWEPGGGTLWVHLAGDSPAAQAWLSNHSGIGDIPLESMSDRETRPRSLLSESGLLVILRGINFNPGEDQDDMVAFRGVFSENRIITIKYRNMLAVEDISKSIRAGKGPANVGDFLVMVIERITDRMGDVVAGVGESADDVEDAIFDKPNFEVRSKLADLRRQAIGLRRYIAPQRDVIARLTTERAAWLSDSNRAYMREALERTARFVEDLESSRDRASVTQEEMNNRLAEQMNKAMYTLSIVAAIFLPLGLLTGLLGINVGGIPGADSKIAFTLVTVFLAVLALGLVALFKKIKWL